MNPADELKAKLGPEYQKPKIVVWFRDHARPDQMATSASGRPRFTSEVYYCERNPKDPTAEVQRLATQEDFERWPDEYAHYQKVHALRSQPRVRFLPGIDVGTVAEMNAIGVYTLEDLVADTHPEWNEWRQLARKVLDALGSDAPVKESRNTFTASAGGFEMEFAL